MKTSNKLLIGLFALIVVSMIIVNIALKRELKLNTIINTQSGVSTEFDYDSIDSDSIEMENAIKNE